METKVEKSIISGAQRADPVVNPEVTRSRGPR